MSLGTKLVQAVQKEAAMQRPLPLSAAAHDILPGKRRASASVTLADNDRFSHLVESVQVQVQVQVTSAKATTAPRQASAETKARRFAERATYLTEALQFVECDAAGKAVLRSSPATMAGPRAPYYEARVGDDALALQRYQPNLSRPGRAAMPFCLTDEVLARLTDDAAAVLAPTPR